MGTLEFDLRFFTTLRVITLTFFPYSLTIYLQDSLTVEVPFAVTFLELAGDVVRLIILGVGGPVVAPGR